MSTLGGALADLDGVAEAYSVTGEWDFVAIVRVPRHEKLAEVVTGELGQLAGRQPHPDDGRLRGLLAPRPRGAVRRRSVSERARRRLAAGSNQRARSFQSCTISRPPVAASAPRPRGCRKRAERRPVSATPAMTAPVAPWWQR